jgi:hypothetical protein
VIRLLPLVLLPLLLPAQTAPKTENPAFPLGGNLGRVWRIRDWNKPLYDFKGAWVRRPNSLDFDLDYTDTIKGKEGRKSNDVVHLISIKGDQVVLRLGKTERTFTGTIQLDGKTIKGRGDWCRAAIVCGWEAVTDWVVTPQLLASISGKPRYTGPADAGKAAPGGKPNLGTLWRVRDNTSPGFNYSGTWSFQAGTDRISFQYKDSVSGQSATGFLTMGDIANDKVSIYNPGRRKYYRGTIQAGGKTIKGTADWCNNRTGCNWEATIEK